MVQLWMFTALCAAFFGALVAIFAKIGLQSVDTTLATNIRSFVMVTFLTLISLSFGKFKFISTIDAKTLLFIILSGLAGALSLLCYFLSLQLGPASSVTAIDRMSVALVFILAHLFLGEIATLQSIIGLILLITGVLMITLK